MNTFQRDVRERRDMARQARNRRGHTGKSGCNLESDRLTQKQWRERCGDVVVCNLNKPMAWADFKNLSRNTQTEYLNALLTRFGANSTNLSEMFGVSALTIRRHVETNGLGIKFRVGHSMTAAQREAWDEFLHGKPKAEEPKEAPEPERAEPAAAAPEEPMNMCGFTLEFCGVIDPVAIANSIRSMMGAQKTAHIKVSCAL